MFLEIALPTPLRRNFDYLLPVELELAKPIIGARVRVPFGRQKLVGIIVAIKKSTSISRHKLKPVIEILDHESIFPEKLFTLLRWTSDYYQHPLGEVLAHALPVLLRAGKSTAPEKTKYWRLNSLGLSITLEQLKRAPRQIDGLNLLKKFPQGINAEELKSHPISNAILKKFITAGWLEEFAVDHIIPAPPTFPSEKKILALNPDQQYAITAITQSLEKFQTFLLAGITGSGKTEVYLCILEKLFSLPKQALVLVPEIALTPQTLQRFQSRFNEKIAVYHSGLNTSQRLQTWLQVKAGEVKLVIATRSGIFLPFKNLGMIIIDEEHDLSFKQHEGLRYSARDLAIRRAQLENIPIVLGSATPSLESLYNVKRQRYQQLNLPDRAGKALLPELKIVDMRSQRLMSGLTPALIEAIKTTLENKQQILLFLNRRGYSPVYLCHECGWIANCLRCDAALTLHHSPLRLHCHHCNASRAIMSDCPQCQSKQLISVGVGTQRLEKQITELFPYSSVIRIDRDSTRRKGTLDKQLNNIQEAPGGQILIGTQMLAKGHHFPNVTLVGVINADDGLFSSDFRALERTGQLLLQVAGRAGRADKPGTVLIQTHHPEHRALQQLIQQDYFSFAEALLADREMAKLPPFTHLALLRAESVTEKQALQFLITVRESAKKIAAPAVEILGPISAIMEKRAGRYRAQLLFRSSQRTGLQKLLAELLLKLENHPTPSGVRWSIDIDPQEM